MRSERTWLDLGPVTLWVVGIFLALVIGFPLLVAVGVFLFS